jgi:rhodanese-related sulfurtransferase
MTETITPEDARQPVASNEVLVLDIRAEEEWLNQSTRIPGALHIPADELESRVGELPEDKRILVVSPDGEGCAEVAEKLDGEGREAVSLEGGVEAWKEEGLMTQPSPDADPPKGEGEEPVEDEDDSEEPERTGESEEGDEGGTAGSSGEEESR